MPAETLLVVGLTGRALAASAVAAGHPTIVLDAFADLDTRSLAIAWRRLPLRGDWSFRREPLLRAAGEAATPDVPLLPGAGFERRPELLRALSVGRELLGTAPDLVQRIKDPWRFAAACAAAGVPHPPIRATMPADRRGWLVKRRGGAGGGHVRDATAVRRLGHRDHLQRRVPGRAVSVLLLGDGRSLLPLATSEQHHGRSPTGRLRFESVLVPAPWPAPLLARLEAAAVAVGRAFAADGAGIRGLASADFLVAADGGFHLLEINPRPGASLEAIEAALGVPLVGLHVAACRGLLPERAPPLRHRAATRILYAPRSFVMPALTSWPPWAGDRTAPGEPVPTGAPVATILACTDDAEAPMLRLAERATELWRRLGVGARPTATRVSAAVRAA